VGCETCHLPQNATAKVENRRSYERLGFVDGSYYGNNGAKIRRTKRRTETMKRRLEQKSEELSLFFVNFTALSATSITVCSIR
jgi:hypothetical protein